MRSALVVLLVLSLSLAARAERITVDPPLKLLTYKKDKSPIAGSIVAYDDDGFDVTDAKSHTSTLAWKDLEAKNVFQIHERMYVKATGEQWLALAQQLVAMPDGKPFAERALVKAIKLDPTIRDKSSQVLTTQPSSATKPSASASPDSPGDDSDIVNRAPPKTEGAIDRKAWGKLSDDKMAAAVKASIAFADETKTKVNSNLSLYETKFFLFYSDLKTNEAQQWAGVLDRMYARLADMFNVPTGSNIWRGKALIFVFASADDYKKFERVMNQTDAGGTAGMFVGRGDGFVNIAFFRQPDEMTFAHVLVHESTHGFLFRYRSPENVPNWANEGLAEWMAAELLQETARSQRVTQVARENLRRHSGIENLMEAEHIEGWQYPVAQSLCEFMIRQNKAGYVAFINAIKDGMSADDALEKKYGAPAKRLIPAFAESLGVKGVTAGK